MGVIVKEIEVIGDKGKTKVKALFDSGASDSIIRKDIAEKISTLLKWRKPIEFTLADDETVLESQYIVYAECNINGNSIPPWPFHVVDKLEDELILGADAFQRWKFKLDFEKEDVIIDKQALRLRIV